MILKGMFKFSKRETKLDDESSISIFRNSNFFHKNIIFRDDSIKLDG